MGGVIRIRGAGWKGMGRGVGIGRRFWRCINGVPWLGVLGSSPLCLGGAKESCWARFTP